MTGPTGDDAFRTYDAAYVLGALTPAEREAYEQHLRDCQRCRDAVRSFAGLPGLLSRVPVEEVSAPPTTPPPDALPALLAAAARQRRRAHWLLAAGGAVAAAVCLVLAVLLAVGPDAAAFPPAQHMTAVAQSPLHATVALRDKPWGTDVLLRCRYDGEVTYPSRYSLVVVDTHGRTDSISSWAAVPETTAVLAGTTSVHPDEVRTVQVRTSSGVTVLSLSP